jgi:acyl carrier protein
MTKEVFLSKLEEVIEIEPLTEKSPLKLDSMQVLGVIVFVDENFDKQLKTKDIQNIQSVSDLIELIEVKFD